MRRQDPQQQLEQAIYDGDLAAVKKCLEQGADVNKRVDGRLPAVIAISEGSDDIASFLLHHGTDLSLPAPLPPQPVVSNPEATRPFVVKVFAFLKAITPKLFVGTAMSLTAARLRRAQLLSESATQHICAILNPQTPLGVEIISFITSVLPLPGFRPRLGTVPHLLVLYSLSHKLDGRYKAIVGALLSWSWKGIFGRAVLDVAGGALVASLFNRAKRPPQPTKANFGGLEVIDGIVSSKFKRESLILTILELGILTPEYIQRVLLSEETPGAREKPSAIAMLWQTSVECSYPRAIQSLLDLGIPVDLDLSDPLYSLLNDGKFKATALAIAAHSRDLPIIRILLGHGADPNVRTGVGTPLILALGGSRTDADNMHDLVELFIEKGVNVNAVDEEGQSPLMHAAKHASPQIILRRLVQSGADARVVDKRGRTAIHHLCAEGGGEEALDALASSMGEGGLEIPDNEGLTPFLLAAYHDQVHVARHLLMRDVNPLAVTQDGRNALALVARYGPHDMVKLLLEAGVKPGTDALLPACHRHVGRAPILSLMLNGGADPNCVSWEGRPLHIVCRWMSYSRERLNDYSDQLESIRLLIQHGADVNSTHTNTKRQVHRGRNSTPLGLVAAHASSQIRTQAITLLLNAGADPGGLDDEGRQALLALCAQRGSLESLETFQERDGHAIEQLLHHGARVTDKDSKGMNCIHHAAQSRNFHGILVCLRHLPDGLFRLEAEDNKGRTALLVACADTYWMTQTEYQEWSEHQSAGNFSYGKWHSSLESSFTLRTLQFGGASPYAQDGNGASSLHIAAKAGNPRIMATLLLWTGPSLLYDFADKCDRLAFHYAARSVEVTRMLLEYHQLGTVNHSQYFDVVEFSEASFAGSISRITGESIEQIGEKLAMRRHLASHPDLIWDHDEFPKPWRVGVCNKPDSFGNTPLHYAALAGCVAVVELYLSTPGVQASATNNDGETALDYGYARGDSACIRAILAKEPGLVRRQKSLHDRHGSPLSPPEDDQALAIRKAAEAFVDRLGKSYLWGVYE